ncbi:MAG: CpaF family protein, partial [Lachnospiraceae bacterium]|nr:CpaF family protein [Lachnospiraceae bacterium]
RQMILDREQRRNRFRALVLQRIDGSTELDDNGLRLLIENVIREHCRKESLTIQERRETKKDVFDSLRRLDVLQDLMEDGSITEIMVNGPDHIFYEREGQLYQSERRFFDRKRLEDVIQKIASGVNRVINEANPIVDARLPDGSRVNAVLPPVSLSDAVLTIRKFPEERITMQQLITMGSITKEAAEYLKVLVRAGYNIFVSGDNVIIGLSPSDFRKRGSHGGLVHICLRRQ